MSGYFIYVFDKEVRDRMLDAGYLILRNDESNSTFVFAAAPEIKFDFGDAKYICSSQLTFGAGA